METGAETQEIDNNNNKEENKPSFQCILCHKPFKNQDKLDKHIWDFGMRSSIIY